MRKFMQRRCFCVVTGTSKTALLVLGRNRFAQIGFRFYPKTGLGFLVQKKWTVSISHRNTSVTIATSKA